MIPIRFYLALILAAQFLVPLVPSWGAFIPHDHWTRTNVTAADWDAHFREHLTGHVANYVPSPGSNETLIISTWAHNGLSSFHALLAAHDADFEFAPVPSPVLATLSAPQFTARALSYPPLVPPPTG